MSNDCKVATSCVGTLASPGGLKLAEKAAFATASYQVSILTLLNVPAASAVLLPAQTSVSVHLQDLNGSAVIEMRRFFVGGP